MLQHLSFTVAGMLLVWASLCPAQAPTGGAAAVSDPMAAPSEFGVRLTPGIARGLVRELVRDEIVRRYNLNREQEPELVEIVTRRLMEAAHAVDTPETQAAIERLFAASLRTVATRFETQGRTWLTPELGQSLSRDLLPFMPQVRELIRKTAQDIRPHLPLVQQLRMAADLAAASTALDGFEATMQQWSKGDVDVTKNPFDFDLEDNLPGPGGAMRRVEEARSSINAVEREIKAVTDRWTEYVKQAKVFYAFDDAQSTTADSVLREVLGRLRTQLGNEEAKRSRYLTMFWNRVCRHLGADFLNGDHPLQVLLTAKSMRELGEQVTLWCELTRRIEEIVIVPQRQAADQRVEGILREVGLTEDELAASAPASAAEGGTR